MLKVLFICHGNICRSPMAQFVFQHLVNQAGLTACFHISSAATSTEEIGNPIHHGTMGIFRKYSIPCSGHHAVQMKKTDYEKYDWLIGMDQANIRNMNRICGGDPNNKIYKLTAFAGSSKDVADPWYTGDFEVTYRDVLAGCQGLLEEIRNRCGML